MRSQIPDLYIDNVGTYNCRMWDDEGIPITLVKSFRIEQTVSSPGMQEIELVLIRNIVNGQPPKEMKVEYLEREIKLLLDEIERIKC